MGNKVHDLKKRKLTVELKVDIELDKVVQWSGSNSIDESVNNYIDELGIYDVANHIANDLIQEHIIEDEIYDAVHFTVTNSEFTDVYFKK